MPESSSPSKTQPQVTRQRGGQQGNRNALKHGFYTRQFNPTDIADLNKFDFTGLDHEIILLRVLMRRLVESARSLADSESLSALLRHITLTSIALIRLYHTSFILNGLSTEKGLALFEAVAQLEAASKAGP